MSIAARHAPPENGAAADPAHPAVADLIATGAHLFPAPVDPAAAERLLGKIRALRTIDDGLFLGEAEFDADPHYRGVNPQPGRNLLERFEADLAFVERSPMITGTLQALLGDGYDLLDKKVVCGVPASTVPPWLKARIEGAPVNNLGPYVRPEFRDVTYFYGIDFHQDLIDYKARAADFVTLYVYLHPVGEADAPLFLLEGTHALGGTLFPHDLTRTGPETWRYGDRKGQAVEARQRVLTGPTGFAALWHACTLHGTQPHAADRERFSLRYLLARQEGGATTGVDQVNATLKGPLSLVDTRVDLARDGSAAMRANSINRTRAPST